MTTEQLRRHGHSLLEVVIALTLLGLVLAAVVATTTRTWRSHIRAALRADARAQLQAATHAIAYDLRAVSAIAFDIPQGTARDSSIELRTLVAHGIICDTTRGIAIQWAIPPDIPNASTSLIPAAGDTMWMLVEDTIASWHGAAVTSTRRDAGICQRDGRTIVVALERPLSTPALGTPVRFTRHARWSLYRSTEAWFLGRREWNASLRRFDVVQPVAGPLAPYGRAAGLELRYFDDEEAELPSGSTGTHRIARVDVMLRAKATSDSERISIALGRTEATP